MNLRWEKNIFFALLMLMGICLIPAQAGGPLTVTGENATQQGRPYRWILNPIPYNTDRGGLGNQTNAQANDLVASAFQAWKDVNTADLHIESAGSLDSDVTSANILAFFDAAQNCNNPSPKTVSIIYDVDGSILTALGYDNNSILGFAGDVCSDEVAGTYTRGLSLLNGRFIDGRPDTISHNTVSLEDFKRVFIHEFGHLIGLDHSQINLNCLTEISCPEADLAGLPIMFPVLLDESPGNLKTDDKSAISTIYPAGSFSVTTGRIRGRVLFSDGQTQAQGYNVIARKVGDPRTTAVSSVSGFLYTASIGNPFYPNPDATDIEFGSRDQTLIGFYDIPGLPPGEYTIEVEPINNSGINPFTGGSSVGPIGDQLGFQYKMPGTCSRQYLNYPSSPGDSCSAFTTISVAAGSIVDANTDVILLGTPSRFDAWEDEP
jgi:hypothetical protein